MEMRAETEIARKKNLEPDVLGDDKHSKQMQSRILKNVETWSSAS